MKALAMEPLTVEDYRSLPDGGPRYQLIEGDLFMAPAPNRYHQEISGNIYLLLAKYLEKHPIGKLYAAPFDVYFDEINVHQPDLVFVSRKNLSILTHAGADHVYFLQKDAERPAATWSEKDTFASPHFPGLKIKGATVFKR